MTTMTLPANAGLSRRISASFWNFVATPARPAPLAAMRIGVSLVLLCQAISLAGSLLDLYGPLGVVQWAVTDSETGPGVPRISWLAEALAPLGVSDVACVRAVFAMYVAGLVSLLMGYQTRAAAVVTWLTHLTMKTSALASIYGVDSFAQIALFYCMWMPVGEAWSIDRWFGWCQGGPSSAARLGLRVVQLHLCVVYLASGLEKSLGVDWWNGEAIWCALMRPDLCAWDMSWLARWPVVAALGCWGTLLVEIGYAVFVWPRRTRKLWAMTTISMHVGIAIFLGLTSFAALMAVLTFSAFMVSGEPRELEVISAID